MGNKRIFKLLTVTLYPVQDLTGEMIDAIWKMYEPYHSFNRAGFLERLKGMDYYALYRTFPQNEFVGSTGIRYRTQYLESIKESVDAVCFGQSFIAHDYRGRHLIERTVTEIFLRSKLKNPLRKVIFWTTALTYKPYLVMTRNLAEYYPRRDYKNSALALELVEQIGKTYYKELYNPDTQVVQREAKWVNDRSTEIGEIDLMNADIRFYNERNPDYLKGHGLIILCPLSMKNLMSYLRKAIRQTAHKICGTHGFSRRVSSPAPGTCGSEDVGTTIGG